MEERQTHKRQVAGSSPVPAIQEAHMEDEHDPKLVATKARKHPEVEKMLRSFMPDGPKGNSKTYKENLEAALSNCCLDCDGFGTVGIKGRPPHFRTSEKCSACDGSGKKT